MSIRSSDNGNYLLSPAQLPGAVKDIMRGLPIDEIDHGIPAPQTLRADMKTRRKLEGEATHFVVGFEPVSSRPTVFARICSDAPSSISPMVAPASRRQIVLGIIHLPADGFRPALGGATRRMAIDVTAAGAVE